MLRELRLQFLVLLLKRTHPPVCQHSGRTAQGNTDQQNGVTLPSRKQMPNLGGGSRKY